MKSLYEIKVKPTYTTEVIMMNLTLIKLYYTFCLQRWTSSVTKWKHFQIDKTRKTNTRISLNV